MRAKFVGLPFRVVLPVEVGGARRGDETEDGRDLQHAEKKF